MKMLNLTPMGTVPYGTHLLAILAQRGIRRVRGYDYPTTKNEMVRSFWAQQGFTALDEETFELELAGAMPEVRFIRIEVEKAGVR